MNSIFSIIVAFSFFVAQSVTELRAEYYEASKTKQNAEKFYNKLANYTKTNTVILAYKGAGLALKSKFATNKKDKKEFFIAGVQQLENAVNAEPNNLEIRLIRLSVQENTPKFLKYKANIEEDKKQIISSFDKQNKELKEFIKKYIAISTVFTESEKQKIK